MGRNKTKNNQGLKDSEKKFSYLVSEIFLQTNDCLAPEGDQKDKWNELKLQDFDAGHCLWFKFYINTAFHHPQGVAHVFTIEAFFPHELDLL